MNPNNRGELGLSEGLSESMPLRAARPGQQVLCLVPVGAGVGWCETDHASAQESESERVRRALGSIGETGVPVKAGSVWRRSVATQPDRIHGSLSSGTQSPGQRQPATDATGCVEGPEDPLPPTARRLESSMPAPHEYFGSTTSHCKFLHRITPQRGHSARTARLVSRRHSLRLRSS